LDEIRTKSRQNLDKRTWTALFSSQHSFDQGYWFWLWFFWCLVCHLKLCKFGDQSSSVERVRENRMAAIIWSYTLVIAHLKGVEQGRYVDVFARFWHPWLSVDARSWRGAYESSQDAKNGRHHSKANVLIVVSCHFCWLLLFLGWFLLLFLND